MELKILVEDDIINQKVALSLFKQMGYSIEIAGHGEEAMEKINKTEYDIIFMDMRMPVKDGVTTTRELRENGNKTPIIALTANADLDSKDEATNAGINEILVKPVRMNELKAIIQKWID